MAAVFCAVFVALEFNHFCPGAAFWAVHFSTAQDHGKEFL
jgi:hypothetical protein